jgi:hypothetical protein
MKDPKRVWAWVGVIIVVIVVIAWVLWMPKFGSHQAATTSPMPVYAPQGQLVPQFPKALILDSNAAISGSYSIGYSSSTNQYTAEYDSSSTVTSLYKMYQTYLAQNNWTVTGSLTTHPTFDVIAATQGNDQLQVVISTVVGGGSQATITYVAQ